MNDSRTDTVCNKTQDPSSFRHSVLVGLSFLILTAGMLPDVIVSYRKITMYFSFCVLTHMFILVYHENIKKIFGVLLFFCLSSYSFTTITNGNRRT